MTTGDLLPCNYVRQSAYDSIEVLRALGRNGLCSHVVCVDVEDKLAERLDVTLVADSPCFYQDGILGKDCGKRGQSAFRILARQRKPRPGAGVSASRSRSKAMMFVDGKIHTCDPELVQVDDDAGSICFSVPPYSERPQRGVADIGQCVIPLRVLARHHSEPVFGRIALSLTLSEERVGRRGLEFGSVDRRSLKTVTSYISITIPGPKEADLRAEVDGGVPEVSAIVSDLNEVDLGKMRVIGDYARFDEQTRLSLQRWATLISEAARTKQMSRSNYLIWAPPGSGKTYFVRELSRCLGSEVGSYEYNLLEKTEEELREWIGRIKASRGPCLCFVDEIDGKASASWPYEWICPALDIGTEADHPVVFVMVGSIEGGLGAMEEHIKGRRKGPDMLSRIPASNHFTIPAASRGDRVCVFGQQLTIKGREVAVAITRIEKLALVWVLLCKALDSPRRIEDLAAQIVDRVNERGDNSVLFDDLFERGSRAGRDFIIANPTLTKQFSEHFCEFHT